MMPEKYGKGVIALNVLITSTGPSLDDQADERFGRARWLLLVEAETQTVLEAIDNHTQMNAMQGSGIKVAEIAGEKGAAWVLTGYVGPKAFAALQAMDVRIGQGVQGSGRQVIASFLRGEFAAAEAPNAESHW
ncbi:dinitrogenase iron-molybdenum cofactor biosynthesis protein [Heliobacterium gestii]|uniref:Dinitrogenase iron-molybdenum cofactor biosynthesis protein n=1 Tax=Heliomicrobium gestii TaxID=2699 RepID=A0A845L8J4_HELGE|nr:NifB/NifX family molybdenum-iron cluster-binding protein [Heliomicrobium gestii]MBM7866252.1 putative Fe-Mo cluster-binding NifX family protein [Heliomicrobium gestii]MZP42952.1 dinitrogenase iron-molybdenum cofactor biosynthesis protein [Heliomicrobium gestii]